MFEDDSVPRCSEHSFSFDIVLRLMIFQERLRGENMYFSS
jgi:hypothetical protein